jgi:hypothetical protein
MNVPAEHPRANQRNLDLLIHESRIVVNSTLGWQIEN